MIERCYMYLDGVKVSIVLDTSKFKYTITHGNTNKTLRLDRTELLSGVHHLWYSS